jgi:hypothetical protein
MEDTGTIAIIFRYRTKYIQRCEKTDFKTYYMITNHIAEGKINISVDSHGRTNRE